MGNGLRLGLTGNQGHHKPKTKKGNQIHEKSKHSVQTISSGSHPATSRLPCGSVHLGAQSGSSP
jgi:hypothetical protein